MCWTQGAVWEQPDMEQDRAGAALPALFPPIPGWHFGRELKGKIPEVIPAAATSFCWDSNGAPGCPKAWVGLIPLLLINKGLSRAFICLLIPGFQTPSSFGALSGPATTRLCKGGWMRMVTAVVTARSGPWLLPSTSPHPGQHSRTISSCCWACQGLTAVVFSHPNTN